MLYREFLEGTGAVDNEDSYKEYKRVEQIYMESDHCTKEDAYRMARVETYKEREARQKKERKAELKWVKENVIGAAAFIRGMAEKNMDWTMYEMNYQSTCGNKYTLKTERRIGSTELYSLWCNGKKVLDETSESGWMIDRAEIASYRANWYNTTLEELKNLFGYIA